MGEVKTGVGEHFKPGARESRGVVRLIGDQEKPGADTSTTSEFAGHVRRQRRIVDPLFGPNDQEFGALRPDVLGVFRGNPFIGSAICILKGKEGIGDEEKAQRHAHLE